MYEPYSHCTACGTPFSSQVSWPRSCQHCGYISFRNPLPVSVVLVPVANGARQPGLLAVRRAIAPRIGKLALPGGCINYGESWQEAGAREVLEETGVIVDPAEIREVRVRSAPDGTLIIFGKAREMTAEKLPPFVPNDEASERLILSGPTQMAFGLHTEIVSAFFTSEGQ